MERHDCGRREPKGERAGGIASWAKSGYSAEAMARISPEIVLVSTAKLPPEHDAVPQYRQHSDYVFSTRTAGSITIDMQDNGVLSLYDESGNELVTSAIASKG